MQAERDEKMETRNQQTDKTLTTSGECMSHWALILAVESWKIPEIWNSCVELKALTSMATAASALGVDYGLVREHDEGLSFARDASKEDVARVCLVGCATRWICRNPKFLLETCNYPSLAEAAEVEETLRLDANPAQQWAKHLGDSEEWERAFHEALSLSLETWIPSGFMYDELLDGLIFTPGMVARLMVERSQEAVDRLGDSIYFSERKFGISEQ